VMTVDEWREMARAMGGDAGPARPIDPCASPSGTP
jgi:hypothetical protein